MVQVFGDFRGGIVGLLSLPREDWEAIEADLLRDGFTLSDVPRRVTWRALLVKVRNPWRSGDYVSALTVDALQVLIWQNTEDGQKGVNMPAPIPRPGDVLRKAAEVEQTLEVAREQGWIS